MLRTLRLCFTVTHICKMPTVVLRNEASKANVLIPLQNLGWEAMMHGAMDFDEITSEITLVILDDVDGKEHVHEEFLEGVQICFFTVFMSLAM